MEIKRILMISASFFCITIQAMQQAVSFEDKLSQCISYTDYQNLSSELDQAHFAQALGAINRLFDESPKEHIEKKYKMHLLWGLKCGLIDEELWNFYTEAYYRLNEDLFSAAKSIARDHKRIYLLINELQHGAISEIDSTEFMNHLMSCVKLADYKKFVLWLKENKTNETVLKIQGELDENLFESPERNFRFLIACAITLEWPDMALEIYLTAFERNEQRSLSDAQLVSSYYQTFVTLLYSYRNDGTITGPLFRPDQAPFGQRTDIATFGLPEELNLEIMVNTLTAMLNEAHSSADFYNMENLRLINRTSKRLFDECINNASSYFKEQKLVLAIELLKLVLKYQRTPEFETQVNACCRALNGIDRQDDEGFTALMRATMYDFPTIVQCLLNLGANPDIESNDNAWIAVNLAVEYGSVEPLKILLNFIKNRSDAATWNNFVEEWIDFPHIAYEQGHKELIPFFISMGFNLDEMAFTTTVFLQACDAHDLETIMLLERSGVSIDLSFYSLESSLSEEDLSCFEYLFNRLCSENESLADWGILVPLVSLGIDYEGSITELTPEIRAKKLELIKRAIAKNIDLHYQRSYGASSLSEAITLKDKEIIRILLDSGFDISRVNPDYCYQCALETHDEEIIATIKALIQKDTKHTDDHEEKELR